MDWYNHRCELIPLLHGFGLCEADVPPTTYKSVLADQVPNAKVSLQKEALHNFYVAQD